MLIAAALVSRKPARTMAAPPKKASQQAVQAELALTHSLKSCLVNLPASLVAVLVNANAVSASIDNND